MHTRYTLFIGKAVKQAAQLRGGGTALPGLVVEKMDRAFVAKMLADLPLGVVVISGTNGKTTTTKIVTEVLEQFGLKVFTNKTGSNFVRGIAAAILGETDSRGKLPHDIAVLELDEAHAVQFIRHAHVDHALILNVMRDQLDRFGEIDYTASLLSKLASTASKTVILNRDDPRISSLEDVVNPAVKIEYFGADPSLHHIFVNDDKLHQSTSEEPIPPKKLAPAAVELAGFKDDTATMRIDGQNIDVTMQLTGVYNYLNAAGALALCQRILGDKATPAKLVKALETVKPAFGRGETVKVGDQEIELVLVKNPAGFRLALASFNPASTPVMIAINDEYADGRDMSWLWDVDFSSLASGGVAMVTGIRAYDMALRLRYDKVTVSATEPDLKQALDTFITSGEDGKKRIFCTYTAMLKLRRLMRKYTKLEIMG